MDQSFGIIGNGSWATALTKILTDRKQPVNWWIRNEQNIEHIRQRGHNPSYLSSVEFDTTLLNMSADVAEIVDQSDIVVIAVPSAFVEASIGHLPQEIWAGKKIVSAIKGILPEQNILLNEYLHKKFNILLHNYFAVLGPCHAEEVAEEKLSYLTFSGADADATAEIASHFTTDYINTIVNQDIFGVQYAAVLKNIYALGAGIAHGLEYGDNFLSVYIANAADEMAMFLKKAGARHIVAGEHAGEDHKQSPNYAASVYLGDLLVTCYSLHSRNRMFGNMIGKGYSAKAAQLEMSMIAEGFNAAKCIYQINKTIGASIPIADTIYSILWENVKATQGFKRIEQVMV
jgi:glycerol-3-phosphate dehydrogenase (NAD(P)+)